MKRLVVIVALLAASAFAQENDDPDDEPMPAQPPTVYLPPPAVDVPPVVYVPAAPAVKKATGGFVARLEAGAAYRYALKESFGAVAAHLFLGGERRALGFGGVMDLELGGSKLGLFYSTIDWGFEFDGRVGERLRLGIGPHFGVMVIARRTDSNPSEDLSGFLAGVAARAQVELVRARTAMLLLCFRVGYDFVDTGRLYSYAHGADLQLGLGLRL